MSAMYMASLGGTGIRKLARLNHSKAQYLKDGLAQAGFASPFAAPTFNEFVVTCPDGFDTTYRQLLEKKIVAGVPLGTWYPDLADSYLLCATETASKEDLDALIKEVQS